MKPIIPTVLQLQEKYETFDYANAFKNADSVYNKKFYYLPSLQRITLYSVFYYFKDADFENYNELGRKKVDCLKAIRSSNDFLSIGICIFFSKDRYVHLEVVEYKKTIWHLVYSPIDEKVIFLEEKEEKEGE